MDIHAPDKPVHGFKDFAIHISIVTLGILIALGLEGIRETVHDRHLVREARANFRLEMQGNHDEAAKELDATMHNYKALAALAAAPSQASAAASSPASGPSPERIESLRKAILAIENPFYFFGQNSWQTALSTGALAHMSAEEVSAYAGAADSVRVYTNLQNDAMRVQVQAFAFATSHPHPSPAEAATMAEQFVLLLSAQRALAFVGPQMQGNVDQALRAASVP